MQQVLALHVITYLFPQDIPVTLQNGEGGALCLLERDYRVANLLFAHRVKYATGELSFLCKHLDLLQTDPFACLCHRQCELVAIIVHEALHQWVLHQ